MLNNVGNIVGYTASGLPIYDTAPVSTPRLMMPHPTTQKTQEETKVAPGMTFVDGEVEARAYHIAPGTVLPLWDSAPDRNLIYIKSMDENGMPQKMRILRWEDVTDEFEESPKNSAGYDAMTSDAISKMINDTIDSRIKELMDSKTTRDTRDYKNRQHKNKERNVSDEE